MQSENVVLPEIVEIEAVYTYLRELDALADAVYKTDGGNFDEVINSVISLELHQAVNESIKLSGAGKDADKKMEVIENMRKVIKEIPVVKLQVAVSMSRKSVKAIHDWVRINVCDPVVLEFETDADMMAGARISFGGKYIDKSLDTEWPKIWAEVLVKTPVTENYSAGKGG